MLSSGSAHDLWTGLVAAGLGLLGFVVSRAALGVSYRFHWRWIAQAAHVPREILSNTVAVLATLAAWVLRGRPVTSVMREVAFDDRGEVAEVVSRQTLAVLYETTSPNFIAVGFEGEPGQGNLKLVYHQLLPTPISKGLRHLGAMP